MGEINYNPFMDDEDEKHRRIPADEQQYLNEGKGCAVYSFILVVVLIASACIFCYSVWVGN